METAPTSTDWESLWTRVTEDPTDFVSWELLIRVVETANGGLTKASEEGDLQNFKTVYDTFLSQFPLCFGYWKKYAEWQLTLYDTVRAEEMYERAILAIANSIDLWMAYISFKVEFQYPPDHMRELFERAIQAVGYDFYGHPVWDKYIEFEEAQGRMDMALAILERVIYVPLYQYARYFEKYTQVAMIRPAQELVTPEELDAITAEVHEQTVKYDEATGQTMHKTEEDYQAEIKTKIMAIKNEIFNANQAAVNARWTFEAEIKRPYFHIKPLDQVQLDNWHKYLDFEEEQGDPSRVYILYERCLVPCALYPDFWSRYAHYLAAQGHVDNARYAYQRAVSIFVPQDKPQIRFEMAEFEESQGNTEAAEQLYDGVLSTLPTLFEGIKKRVYLEKRVRGVDAALALLDTKMKTMKNKQVYGGCIVEKIKLLSMSESPLSIDETRALYLKTMEDHGLASLLVLAYTRFELDVNQEQYLVDLWPRIENESCIDDKTKSVVAKLLADRLLLNGDNMSLYMRLCYFVRLGHAPAVYVQYPAEVDESGKRKREDEEHDAQKHARVY